MPTFPVVRNVAVLPKRVEVACIESNPVAEVPRTPAPCEPRKVPMVEVETPFITPALSVYRTMLLPMPMFVVVPKLVEIVVPEMESGYEAVRFWIEVVATHCGEPLFQDRI